MLDLEAPKVVCTALSCHQLPWLARLVSSHCHFLSMLKDTFHNLKEKKTDVREIINGIKQVQNIGGSEHALALTV